MTLADRRNAICAEVVRLIGERRKHLDFSKNKLAYLTGLNQSTISRLENHPENPTLDSLLRIADVLEINLGDIVKRAVKNVDASVAGRAAR